MIPELDLSLSIEPGRGLGGFEVGVPISRYREILRRHHRSIWRDVNGLWQVVYRMPQLYRETTEESMAWLEAAQEWSKKRRRGEDADLGDVVSLMPRPEPEPPAIEVWVDLRDGIIDAVEALAPYQGSFRGLRVGTTFRDTRKAEDVFVRDDDPSHHARIHGVEGIVLSFSEFVSDSEPARDDAVIEAIIVFDPTRSDDGIKSY